MATQQEILEALNRLTAQQVGILTSVQGILGQINASVNGIKGTAKQGAGGGGPGSKAKDDLSVFESVKGYVGNLGKGLGIATAIVGTAVAALSAIPAAVLGIVKASTSFVRAINPSSVEQYERAQRDLSATIGYSLQPVIAYATKALQDWAGILRPSIEQLQPVVERLSASVGSLFTGPMRFLARILSGIADAWNRLLPAVESITDSLSSFFEVLNAFSDAAGPVSFVLDGLVVVLDTTAGALRKMTVAVTATTARLLSLFGGTDSVKKFRESLEGALKARTDPAKGFTAAPNDVSTGKIEDVLRKLNERAYISTTGTATKKSETELLADLINQVKMIEKSPQAWQGVIRDAIKEAFPTVTTAGELVSGRSLSTTGSPPASISTVFDFLVNPGGTLLKSF